MDVKNKVIIITGASQGIGLETATLLSKSGAKVVLAARSTALIENLAKELKDSLAITTDMIKPEDIKNLVQKTLDKYGRIDILINNAGKGMHGFTVETINIEEYKKIIELNVLGVIRVMQEVIPIMRRQGGGMIINISSALSKMFIPNLSAYSSTKYMLNSISLTAREELKKDNIIVSVVLPGMTATNFHKNAVWGSVKWGANREMPKVDPASKVAEKIAEVIRTEEAEARV